MADTSSPEATEAARAAVEALPSLLFDRNDTEEIAINLAPDFDAFAAKARADELERCAEWHDKQAGAWQDQAASAYRLAQSADEAYATEYRAQHETYTKHRIIHQQSARHFRALSIAPGEPK